MEFEEVEECADRLSGREKWLTCKYAIEVTPKNIPKIKLKYCKIYRSVLRKEEQPTNGIGCAPTATRTDLGG